MQAQLFLLFSADRILTTFFNPTQLVFMVWKKQAKQAQVPFIPVYIMCE